MADRAVVSWRRFLAELVGSAAGGLLAVWLFIVLVDPFGRLPVSLPFDRGPVDDNPRFAYPMLAREARFDSAIFGASTVRLLRPDAVGAVLGGRFANLGMNGSTPWEQARLMEVFLRAHPAPHAIVLGVDEQWCEIAPAYRRFSDFAFPEWLYSASPWAGYREMARFDSLGKAGRAFAEWTGLARRKQGRDGYTVFVPDDAKYDPARVAMHMADAFPHFAHGAAGAPADWAMPTLALMREAIAQIPAATRLLLVMVPVNYRMIPEPGTPEAAVLDECARRVAAIAAGRAGTTLIDFMIASDVTLHDANYWDPWHTRVGIADRIVLDIGAALRGGEAADGRVLVR